MKALVGFIGSMAALFAMSGCGQLNGVYRSWARSSASTTTSGGGSSTDTNAPAENGNSGSKSDGSLRQLCHNPPGNPEEKHTLEVGPSAVGAHLAHGDTLGPC